MSEQLRITNYNMTIAHAGYTLLVSGICSAFGVILLSAGIDGGFDLLVLFVLFGLAYLGTYIVRGVPSSLILGDNIMVHFLVKKTCVWDYTQIEAVSLYSTATKVMGFITVSRDIFMLIEIKDGPTLHVKSDEKELQCIKTLLENKGLSQKFDETLANSGSRIIFVPPSLFDSL